MVRIDLGPASDLRLGDVRIVAYDGAPPKKSILVVRTPCGVRAYWNVCRHLPIPLDAGSGVVKTEAELLVCATHGARYEPDQGLCVSGPCRGALLEAVLLELDEASDRMYALIG
jgi:nitrite reductase/ring-hydroxylating ferredoxin subunit